MMASTGPYRIAGSSFPGIPIYSKLREVLP